VLAILSPFQLDGVYHVARVVSEGGPLDEFPWAYYMDKMIDSCGESLQQSIIQAFMLRRVTIEVGVAFIEPVQIASFLVSVLFVGVALYKIMYFMNKTFRGKPVFHHLVVVLFLVSDVFLRVVTVALAFAPIWQFWGYAYFGVLHAFHVMWLVWYAKVSRVQRYRGGCDHIRVVWALTLLCPLICAPLLLDVVDPVIMLRGLPGMQEVPQCERLARLTRLQQFAWCTACVRQFEFLAMALIAIFFDEALASVARVLFCVWLVCSMAALQTLRVLGYRAFAARREPSLIGPSPAPNPPIGAQPLPTLMGAIIDVPLPIADDGEECAAWDKKVRELAGRGFELGRLLEFYSDLGGVLMPHFDPQRSITTDVVRHAIIPGSWSLAAHAPCTQPLSVSPIERPIAGSWTSSCAGVLSSCSACERTVGLARQDLDGIYRVHAAEAPHSAYPISGMADAAKPSQSRPWLDEDRWLWTEQQEQHANPHAAGRAYSEVMQEGKFTPATRMVTHHWSNLFAHLVAAIVADALEVPTFGDILDQLSPARLPNLKSQLASRGLLSLTYWVCAFSVNQHSCICAGFGPEPPLSTEEHAEFDSKCRDSVTGDLYPLCHCRTVQPLNSHPAELFDNMVEYMASCTPGLRQVVVVDENLEVFTRAWVVSELSIAHRLQIPQAVKMRNSASFLAGSRKRIGEVKVENCKASRPEDVWQILSKIDNIQEFNRSLNTLIFGQRIGLLDRYRSELTLANSVKVSLAIGALSAVLESAL